MMPNFLSNFSFNGMSVTTPDLSVIALCFPPNAWPEPGPHNNATLWTGYQMWILADLLRLAGRDPTETNVKFVSSIMRFFCAYTCFYAWVCVHVTANPPAQPPTLVSAYM